jgi:nitrilase
MAPAERVRAAVIQMTSTDHVEENLDTAGRFLEAAAREGATIAVLPENFGFMGRRETDRLSVAEAPGEGPQQAFLASLAAELSLTVVGGTIPVLETDDPRPRARSVVWNASGQVVGAYDKIHLFDVAVPGGREAYRESAGICPGRTPVVLPSPVGPLGLTVCYDVRFPELYRRLMANGARAYAVPAAFTATTGEAHWEMLVRARAVENLAFVLAAAQTGRHPGGRQTWGHAMIVDPWGRVLGACTDKPGLAVADMDLAGQETLRSRFPALAHTTDLL